MNTCIALRSCNQYSIFKAFLLEIRSFCVDEERISNNFSITMTSGLELSEKHSESGQRGGRRTRHCMLSRLQVAVFVTVAILLMAVVGILMAMFGPGSKNFKYRDDEDCKGRTDGYV